MAGLLSWLNNERKTVQHDIANGAAAAAHGLNPFDGGQGFTTQKPVQAPQPAPQPQQNNGWSVGRVLHDVTHNPVTNLPQTINNDVFKPVQRDVVRPITNLPQTFGNDVLQPLQRDVVKPAVNVAQGLASPFEYLAKADIINPARQLAAQFSHNDVAAQNAQEATNQNLGLGPNGTNFTGGLRTFAGNAAQVGLDALAPGIGGAIDKSFTAVVPKVVPGLLTRTVANAGTGAVLGAPLNAAAVVANPKIPMTRQNLEHSALQGAQMGAVLGGAGTVAAAAVPKVIQGLRNIPRAQRLISVKGAAASKPLTRISVTKLTPTDISGYGELDPSRVQKYRQQIRQTGKIDPILAMRGNGSKLFVEDGKHRLAAAKAEGLKSIPAKIVTPEEVHRLAQGGYVSLPGRRGAASDNEPTGKTTPSLPTDSGEMLSSTSNHQVSSKNSVAPTGKGFIVKETKPLPDGSKIVVRASKNPVTGKLETHQERVNKATDLAPSELSRTQSPSIEGQAPASRLTAEELSSLGKTPDAVQLQPKTRTGTVQPQQLSGRTSQLQPSIELDRSVQNALKRGTSDDAIQTVMDVTGADLQTAAKYVSRVAKQSKIDLGFQDATKNPLLGSVKVPKVKEGDVKQPLLNAKYVQEHEQRIGQRALSDYNKLSAHDQVLLKDIETGTVSKVAQKADNPKAFTTAEQTIRNYYNLRHAYDRYLGIDVGYRTNYLRQIFNKAEQEGPDNQISLKGSGKNPGYTKARSNETLGSNVAEALKKDVQGASFNHGKLAYEKGLNEALKGKVAKGELVRTPEDGAYVQIQNKYGQDLTVPKDIAHEINSRAWGPNASKALNRYDAINHGLKYVKLSGGFFHAFTEAGNFAGQQLASGKLLTNPAATGRLFKVFFSPKTMDAELSRMNKTGVLDNAHLAGLTTQAKEILADANVSLLDKAKGAANKAAKYTGIQLIHDATFQREIPYAKLKLFEQKTEGLDVNKPADLAKMRETARAINNMFGGINREINGIKPSTFKWLQRAVLATDFTEGKWHTLLDAATHGGPAGTIARQAVVGKAILFGLLASAGAAAGGEFTGKNPLQIARNAAGNLLDPQFEIGGYTAKLPKTFISEAIDALKPSQQNQGAPWNASGLLHYATSRTAALPSEAIQLANNKDYYGQPIYGKNSKKNGGAPITPAHASLNVLNTVAPIPFGQGVNTVNGKQNIAAGLANVAGLNVRPNPLNTVSFQGVSTNLTDPQRRAYQAELSATKKVITSQLTNSAAYKNMSPNDKSNALTQLNKNIDLSVQRDYAAKNNLGQYSPNFTGKDTQATVKQQAILSGKIDPSSYAKAANSGTTLAISPKLSAQDKQTLTQYKSTADRTKAFNTQKDAEYQYDLAKYQNDVAKGTLTTAEKIRTQKTLQKEKVGSVYSKNIRDLYGLSKTELNDYLTTSEKGVDKAKIAKQLIAYDQALYNAGLETYLKFKTGIAPSKGGSRGSSSKTSASSKDYLAKLKFDAAKQAPKVATFSGLPKAPAKYTAPALRKYTPKSVPSKGNFTYSIHKGLV